MLLNLRQNSLAFWTSEYKIQYLTSNRLILEILPLLAGSSRFKFHAWTVKSLYQDSILHPCLILITLHRILNRKQRKTSWLYFIKFKLRGNWRKKIVQGWRFLLPDSLPGNIQHLLNVFENLVKVCLDLIRGIKKRRTFKWGFEVFYIWVQHKIYLEMLSSPLVTLVFRLTLKNSNTLHQVNLHSE